MTASNKRLLIVIPARKGSSFRGKNLYPLLGRPLIQYTFDAARDIPDSEVLVTSDDHYVRAECEVAGFNYDDRPNYLADDKATLNQVIYYIAKKYEFEIYCLLPPTSPLRTRDHVLSAIKLMDETRADTVIGATEERRTIWSGDTKFSRPLFEAKKNRQEMEPCYITNGSLFLVRRDIVLKYRSKAGGKVSILPMREFESIDIHNENDINLARYYLGKSNL